MKDSTEKKSDIRIRAEKRIEEFGFGPYGYDMETLTSSVICDHDPELLREVLKIQLENGEDIIYQVYAADDEGITGIKLAHYDREVQKVLAEFGFEAFRPVEPKTFGYDNEDYERFIQSTEDGTWDRKMDVFHVSIFACDMHQRDTGPREDSGLPYIVHPEDVVNMLISWGFYPDKEPAMVMLGWAHDLKEETAATDEEIVKAGKAYGERLLEGINALTFMTYAESHDASRPKESEEEYAKRKADYLRKIADGDPEFLIVKIADRICNAQERAKSDPERALRYLKKGAPLFERIDSLAKGDKIRRTLDKLLEELTAKSK